MIELSEEGGLFGNRTGPKYGHFFFCFIIILVLALSISKNMFKLKPHTFTLTLPFSLLGTDITARLINDSVILTKAGDLSNEIVEEQEDIVSKRRKKRNTDPRVINALNPIRFNSKFVPKVSGYSIFLVRN